MKYEFLYKHRRKLILVLALFGAIFLLLFDFHRFISIFDWIFGVFQPLLIGGCIAFTLNLLMDTLNDRIFNRFHFKKETIKDSISLLTSIILLVLIVIVLLWFVIPQLIESFRLLIQSVPEVLRYISNLFHQIMDKYPILRDTERLTNIKADDIIRNVVDYIQSILTGTLNQTYNFATNTIGIIFTVFVGIMFSFFVLLYKEKLGRQCRQLLFSYLPEKTANQTLYVFHLAYKNFNAFIVGQVLGALIQFILYLVIALICRIPYEFMIAVLIAIFSLIPMFGSYIAYVIGVLLIVTVDPIKAIYFTVVFFVVCNLEGNVIYPRIIGSTIGLPGIWVLAAVTIGANMYGIFGMIFAVPVVATIYTLLAENSQKRLKSKENVYGRINHAPDWNYYNYQTHTFENKPVVIPNVLREESEENHQETEKEDSDKKRINKDSDKLK